MNNFEKLNAMHDRLDEMWGELILMDTSDDSVAILHKDDAKQLFAKLIIQISCMMEYEEQ